MRAISVQERDVAIRVSTRQFQFEVDRKTGVLSGFMMFDSPHAQWDDVVADRLIYHNVAGLRVKDERTGRLYADPFGTGRVLHHEPRKLVHHGQGDRPRCGKFRIRRLHECLQITFEKTYPGAAFAIATEINVYAQYVRWDNILRLKEGLSDRSVQLEYALPLLRSVNGGYFPSWSLWAPVPDAPFAFGEIGGDGQSQASWYAHRFPYCSINAGAGIGLPLMDVFSAAYGFGLALAAPPDLLKPELVFAADKEISQLKLSYGNIGLRRGATWRTSLLIVPHRGDWRVALDWFHRRYRSYFRPKNRKIVDQEGIAYYGPLVPAQTIASWVKTMRLKWTEVRFEPAFGDFIAETADIWDFDVMWSKAHPKWITKGLTRAKVGAYLRMLRRYGVMPMAYVDPGDCDAARATRDFPECIVCNDHGRVAPVPVPNSAKNYILMNPDPDSRWGKHILRQVEAMFDIYPEMAGVFVDQLCYHNYDYGRDDGRTLVGNRPVYDTHPAFLRLMDRIAAILRRRNRTSFANGPYNIEIMRRVDGIMSEGSLVGLAKYSYMCLAKPLLLLTYGKIGTEFEIGLKHCLKYGAFPSVPYNFHAAFKPPRIPGHTLALYARYLPLLETLRGRSWVLRSNPVSFPQGLDGNIFRRRKGAMPCLSSRLTTWFPTSSGTSAFQGQLRSGCPGFTACEAWNGWRWISRVRAVFPWNTTMPKCGFIFPGTPRHRCCCFDGENSMNRLSVFGVILGLVLLAFKALAATYYVAANGLDSNDGHRRLDRFSSVVDMGCYEYVFPGTMFSIK